MESASSRAEAPAPLDRALLAAAAQAGAAAARCEDEPAAAIGAAVTAVYEGAGGVFPSVFVLEHGRLWLVAQRGYPVVPDGIRIERGITGRAARLGRGQLVVDVRADPDYVEGSPGVSAEVAVPLTGRDGIVGVFNLESERRLPEDAIDLLEPFVLAVSPHAEALRSATTLDLAGLARLFVYLGGLRDPAEIAALAAAFLARVLPVELSQLWLWDDVGSPAERASWQADRSSLDPLTVAELELVRAQVDATAVCQLLDGVVPGGAGALVWLPLRANAEEIGALVGCAREATGVDAAQLDAAAVLAAHVAASLDAALSLHRERLSAETDPLTGILNRRGLEQRLERALADAQERRIPLSLVVFDCDDFKEVNDRAGHQFGDEVLRELGEIFRRAVPDSAEVARLGGDEFLVMLPGVGADAAEPLGLQIRDALVDGLAEAGFPLRLSAGISTYPFDGAGASGLLRSADQALYAAKNGGKDRIASFRAVVRREQPALDPELGTASEERGRPGRREGSILGDAMVAVRAIEAEETANGVLARLCKSLVFVVGATACSASRVVDGYLVDAMEHALRQVWLGDEAAYRISDFPLTEDALRSGEPRAVSFLDDVDPAEAFILRELDMNAMLMLPLTVAGQPWGLIELYEMRLRRFSEDDVSLAEFLTAQAMRRLDVVGFDEAPGQRPPVYELPPGSPRRGAPRTR